MRLVLAVLSLLASASLAHAAGKTVRDWTGSCDATACYAETTGAGGLAMGGHGYRLVLSRAMDKAAPWLMQLVAHNVPQPADRMSVAIDGVAAGDLSVSATGDGDGIDPIDAGQMAALFPALRKGSKVAFSFTGQDGEASETFSLSGLAAVMLWVDERQGRVGQPATVSVVGREDTPATAGTDGLKQELLDLRLVRECQWAMPDGDASTYHAESHDLGDGYTLYLVQCTMGAYQPSTMVFLRSSGEFNPLAFADYGSDTGWSGSLYLGTAEFDPKTKRLHNYMKFRGLGDCGASGDWQWTGYAFKLLEYRYKDCNDNEPVDDNADITFPVIYPAK